MRYKHLSVDERIYIENQLKFKTKISEIAREVYRNKENNQYFSLVAQNKAKDRK